jgi:hypothetical protein
MEMIEESRRLARAAYRDSPINCLAEYYDGLFLWHLADMFMVAAEDAIFDRARRLAAGDSRGPGMTPLNMGRRGTEATSLVLTGYGYE